VQKKTGSLKRKCIWWGKTVEQSATKYVSLLPTDDHLGERLNVQLQLWQELSASKPAAADPETISLFYKRAREYLMAWLKARRFHFQNIVNFNLASVGGIIMFLLLAGVVLLLFVLIRVLIGVSNQADILGEVIFQPMTALLIFVGVYAMVSFVMILSQVVQTMDNTRQQLSLLNRLIHRCYAHYSPFDWVGVDWTNEKIIAEAKNFENIIRYQCLLLETYEENPKFFGIQMRRSYYNLVLSSLVAYAATFIISILLSFISLDDAAAT